MNRSIQTAVLAVAGIVLVGGGFLAGTKVGSAQDGATAKTAPPSGGQGRRVLGGGAGGQQPVSGRVISVGDGSITVEVSQPGGDPARSVIALVGTGSRVVRTTETDIKPSDIKVGDPVTIIGQTDATSGAVTANAVIVGGGAQLLFGGQGARGGGSPRPSPTRSP